MRPDPEPAPGARWCTEVASVLAGAAEHAARLAGGIAEDWTDDHGREWAQRAELVARELGRAARESAELATRLGALAVGDDPTGAAMLGSAAASRRRGPRLGGTTGAHVGDARGMLIAELPPG